MTYRDRPHSVSIQWRKSARAVSWSATGTQTGGTSRISATKSCEEVVSTHVPEIHAQTFALETRSGSHIPISIFDAAFNDTAHEKDLLSQIDIPANALVMRADVHAQFDGYEFSYETFENPQTGMWHKPRICCFEKDGAPSIDKDKTSFLEDPIYLILEFGARFQDEIGSVAGTTGCGAGIQDANREQKAPIKKSESPKGFPEIQKKAHLGQRKTASYLEVSKFAHTSPAKFRKKKQRAASRCGRADAGDTAAVNDDFNVNQGQEVEGGWNLLKMKYEHVYEVWRDLLKKATFEPRNWERPCGRARGLGCFWRRRVMQGRSDPLAVERQTNTVAHLLDVFDNFRDSAGTARMDGWRPNPDCGGPY
ncbi:hypothetical protein C8R44DRAFT_954861 [Mycena epipterygia]|nr:hypothetical protein C8R44DRAFT_954861 [Mycena epipterygia]